MADLQARLEDFPTCTTDKLRYRDCDAQGHVNNAVYSTFLESARTEMLYVGGEPILDPGCGFVIVRLELDFVAETHWPGTVDIGSRILKLGTSSVTMKQTIFQNGKVVADAVCVLVQVNMDSRKPQAISDRARARLEPLS
ncbi:acyl-CoA thioesterase [Roseibium sp.]|uniref:acyl-CoA thioesterase n=1 Tax=Roseibium sp. TaxID=1936156 RepID=UPI003A9735CB